jgi:demethylmenaquinone methyltransferase/2-methoxy-6-polyprenyl-1,4-benzoquinol methylase
LYSAFVRTRSEAPGGDDAGSRTPVTGIAAADDCAIRAAVHGQSAYSTDAQLYEARTRLLHHWRQRAVELLRLRRGEVVIDVGCGTGLCFEPLQQRIGPGGTIVGIDASAPMLELAGRRVADHGWRNVVLVQAPVEDAIIPQAADAVLFCAVHDVLQSPAALDNVFAFTRPGARVAAVGGKWAPPWAVGLNALTAGIHAPFIRDFTGFDRPWSRLTDHLGDLQIREIEMGCGFLASGATPASAAS